MAASHYELRSVSAAFDLVGCFGSGGQRRPNYHYTLTVNLVQVGTFTGRSSLCAPFDLSEASYAGIDDETHGSLISTE